MKYIIMADGKGTRWANYNDIPKHFIKINGERIIDRTVRLIKERDENSEIIITSHDPRYEVKGAVRYEPLNNILEIDRFTEELIDNNEVFLYGDTFYSNEAIEKIIDNKAEDILFFGNRKSIVAIKVIDGDLFKRHVSNVRKLYLEGKISKCIGWQVYQSFLGIKFEEKVISDKYILLEDETEDFNSPEDFEKTRRK